MFRDLFVLQQEDIAHRNDFPFQFNECERRYLNSFSLESDVFDDNMQQTLRNQTEIQFKTFKPFTFQFIFIL